MLLSVSIYQVSVHVVLTAKAMNFRFREASRVVYSNAYEESNQDTCTE